MHQILPLPSAFSSESMVLKAGMWNGKLWNRNYRMRGNGEWIKGSSKWRMNNGE